MSSPAPPHPPLHAKAGTRRRVSLQFTWFAIGSRGLWHSQVHVGSFRAQHPEVEFGMFPLKLTVLNRDSKYPLLESP